ncbi:hypothetical protein BGZ95_003683 [Linnemannia exigua]|uniref:Uncharacterized protein n=1 Tax=Linnemannia exigua TaxID=604196 RepID=A0AAD4D4E9_9FUNG|nr:hypothetical protein BGZ95_003683 [Linnemannia exigua]
MRSSILFIAAAVLAIAQAAPFVVEPEAATVQPSGDRPCWRVKFEVFCPFAPEIEAQAAGTVEKRYYVEPCRKIKGEWYCPLTSNAETQADGSLAKRVILPCKKIGKEWICPFSEEGNINKRSTTTPCRKIMGEWYCPLVDDAEHVA